ncbi:sugar phosphate nucleotidyltransferase [Micromonospora sp. NPDC092111]|uniref:sugar phosphate nucleotidyltransferase n=1 Tax=Micromonospora sp. NPDC092111 TaxID=3364289 RepID=UPI0037FECF0F
MTSGEDVVTGMDDVRAVLLAGGRGERMGRLTGQRPKPLVPFGGQCHLIDFSIANALHSGLTEVLLLSHFNEHRLIDYLRSTWELPDRLHIHLGPHDRDVRSGRDLAALAPRPPERGTAEALLANAEFIFTDRYRDVLVLHADHVYHYDYRPMLAHHRSTAAALTIGYQEILPEYVKLFGMVDFDSDGWLTTFVEKPAEPTSNLVFSAFCLFDQSVLDRYLSKLRTTDWRYDLSRDVIPAMLAAGERIAGYPVRDYWEDIGTVDRYHRAHLRLLGPEPTMRPERMPRTLAPELVRSTGSAGPGLRDSLHPTDLRNEGSVEESVLYPGVRIGVGATVRRSVVLPGGSVADGVSVTDSIVLDGERVETDRSGY